MPRSAPDDALLIDYAAGRVDPGLRVLIDAHLALSPESAARLRDLRDIAGAMLRLQAPAQMSEGAIARALAAIDAAATPDVLPSPRIGRWRWAGPGARLAPLHVEGSDLWLFRLEIAPGRAMAHHGHAGREWTVLLEGAYRDAHGRFARGDFIEESGDDEYRPVVDGDALCVCLVALEGPIRARGLTGMFARWITRA